MTTMARSQCNKDKATMGDSVGSAAMDNQPRRRFGRMEEGDAGRLLWPKKLRRGLGLNLA